MYSIADLVITQLRPLAHHKGLQLNNSVPRDQPLVIADEGRLQQILGTLIGNALKFTQKGSIEVGSRVLKGHFKGSDALEIFVIDTGAGISADQLVLISEPFEQNKACDERDYGETGLSLAVTRKLVELHGGTLGIESTIGFGSRFAFTLALAQNDSSQPSLPSLPSLPSAPVAAVSRFELAPNSSAVRTSEIVLASVPRAGHHTILVVDDEPINLQLLYSQLRVEGFSVVKAHGGEEALNLLAEGLLPDAIILDVIMPKINGYEVTQQIRSLYTSRIPIILLTAKAREEDLVEGLAKGANDYLTKPFKKSELIARLRTHLTLSKFDAAARRFVPFTFLELLGKKSLIDVALGESVRKEMSVLFADIRSFTALSEKLGPQRTFTTINRYLSLIQPAVHAHQGFINQIYGDGIMALFVGNPGDAVAASVAMHEALSVFNEGQMRTDNPPFKIGIGINTGPVMLGTLGDTERMCCGVIADTVNIASRIEGMTKMYGSAVLIGETTQQRLSLQDQSTLREVDRVILKGKVEPTSIYEVIDADSSPLRAAKLETLAVFATGLELYRTAHFRDAAQHFAACIQADHSDKAATIYFERCTDYAESIPPNFDGINRLDDK